MFLPPLHHNFLEVLFICHRNLYLIGILTFSQNADLIFLLYVLLKQKGVRPENK